MPWVDQQRCTSCGTCVEACPVGAIVLDDQNLACIDQAECIRCGHGNYTIPLARLVGPTGEVLALDQDERALDRLAERARQAGVANVRTLPSPGEPTLPLEDGSVDLILLYDVLHDHYFSPKQRAALFEEVGRVSRAGGRLSVFPRHMTDEEIEGEVIARARRLGFEKVDEYSGPVVHDDDITEGLILTFRKPA